VGSYKVEMWSAESQMWKRLLEDYWGRVIGVGERVN